MRRHQHFDNGLFVRSRQDGGSMNLRLLLLDRCMPAFVKSMTIRELYRITASAFGIATPRLAGLGYRELLEKYAAFIKAECDGILGDTRRTAEVRVRLHHAAFEAGDRLKVALKIKNYGEFLIAGRIFYKVLGIQFSGDMDGNIHIRRCFFANFFTPEHCEFISAMDKGVARGLSGGTLEFSQRITDRKSCCIAKINFGTTGGGRP